MYQIESPEEVCGANGIPFLGFSHEYQKIFGLDYHRTSNSLTTYPTIEYSRNPGGIPCPNEHFSFDEELIKIAFPDFLRKTLGIDFRSPLTLEMWENFMRSSGPDGVRFCDWCAGGYSLADIGQSGLAVGFAFAFLLLHVQVGNLSNFGLNSWMFEGWSLPDSLKLGLRISITNGMGIINCPWVEFIKRDCASGLRRRISPTYSQVLLNSNPPSQESIVRDFGTFCESSPGSFRPSIHTQAPKCNSRQGKRVHTICERVVPGNYSNTLDPKTIAFSVRGSLENCDTDMFYVVKEYTRAEYEVLYRNRTEGIPRTVLDDFGTPTHGKEHYLRYVDVKEPTFSDDCEDGEVPASPLKRAREGQEVDPDWVLKDESD